MFISSAVMATLYFGGYNYPFMDWVAANAGTNISVNIGCSIASSAKYLVSSSSLCGYRWTMPRFRYDQLMDLGWKTLILLAIANIMITGLWMTFIRG